ncbi:unnamed protein product [Closterium sp. Naga37s-1]|nr:unnamed protein product [Closterium sp. Naga37s-1]
MENINHVGPNATATCHNATGLVALQVEESADSSVQPVSLHALALHLLLTLLYMLYTALCPLLGLLWWMDVSQAQVRAWVQRQGSAVREWVQRQRSALGAKLIKLRRAAASLMTLGIFPRVHDAIELCTSGMRSVSEALFVILKPMFGAAMLRQALERRIRSLDMQLAAARREEAERERAMEWSELRRLLNEIRDGEKAVFAEVVREREEREKVRMEMHELRERLGEALGGAALASVLRERLGEAMGSGALESLVRERLGKAIGGGAFESALKECLGEAMGSGALKGEEEREGGGERVGPREGEEEKVVVEEGGGEEEGKDERMKVEWREGRREERKRVERRREEKREERRRDEEWREEERRDEERRTERKEKRRMEERRKDEWKEERKRDRKCGGRGS